MEFFLKKNLKKKKKLTPEVENQLFKSFLQENW